MNDLMQLKNIKTKEPMKKHATFCIGGPADFFVRVDSTKELIAAVTMAKKKQIPFFILGSGSNILVGDKGIRGLVIENNTQHFSIKKDYVEADSGCLLSKLVSITVNLGLSGLEYFSGIPGTLGGAIWNNSHYLDNFLGNNLISVKIFSDDNQIKTLAKDDLELKYDYSRFHKTKEIILSAKIRLKKANKNELQSIAKKIISRRRTHHPLEEKSAGCYFKNPDHLQAGYLIEKAGLKGFSIKDAQISPKHANFIINTGKAKAKDVLQIAKYVKKEILKRYKIKLAEEVMKVGEF